MLSLAVALACGSTPARERASCPSIQRACEAELRAAVALVSRNYAGYADKQSELQPALADALSRCEARAHDAASAAACDAALSDWLSSFEDGHLLLIPAVREPRPAPSTVEPVRPSLTLLGDDASALRIPSFGVAHRAEISRLLAAHRDALSTRAVLLLDLRGNGGGSDSAYEPLLPLLYTEPIPVVGADVLATPENAAAWERLLDDLPASEAALTSEIRAVVARMRAHPGELIELSPDRILEYPTVLPAPERVVVLYDRGCKSACEQFLLAARASEKTMFVGEPSGGVLDYANVRVFPLPSQARLLAIPTSRSRRVGTQPVDGIGIAPDVAVSPEALAQLSYTNALELVSSRRTCSRNRLCSSHARQANGGIER